MQMDNISLFFALKNEVPEETDTHAFFRGTVATNQIAESRGLRFNDRSLRQIARSINNGEIKVQVGHDQGFAIGKALEARFNYDEKTVEAIFDIQKRLRIQRSGFASQSGYETSDDYINALRAGTLDGMSMGVNVKKVLCDYCSLEMEPVKFFDFVVGFRDKNGHVPKMVIYKDSSGKEHKVKKSGTKEIIITGAMDDVDPFEVSLVNREAIPGSKVDATVENAVKEGRLTTEQFQMISDGYQMTFSDDRVIYNIPFAQKSDMGGFQMNHEEKLQEQINNQNQLIAKMQSNQTAADTQINELDAKVIELEDENKELRASKELSESQAKQIAELQEELQKFNEESYKVKLYDNLLEESINEAVYQWTRAENASGRKVTTELQEKQANVYKTIGNYKTIMAHAEQDRRTATQQHRIRLNESNDATGTGVKLDTSRLG